MDIKNITKNITKNTIKKDKNMNWNEKYRPTNLENIILSNYNKLFLFIHDF